MKFVIIIKNRLENIYKKFPRLTGYAGKLVFSLACLLILRTNCGYNESLTNIWIVLVISIFCAFAPSRFLLLILCAYTLVQFFSLSIGVGCICTAIMMAVYFIYFRFDQRHVYFIMLIPLFSMIKLPLLIPLILAVVGSLDMVAVVLLGNVIYYMIRFVNVNAAVISGMTDQTEYAKMSFAAKGIFTNTEFLYTLIIMLLVFLLVYYARRLNMNQANNLAVAAGTGAYIILVIVANLIFKTLTATRLYNLVIGAVIAGLLAAFIVYALLPLDYTRTEAFEFEDEEYHYYVRAVPKAVIKRESVKVKKINTRKEIHPQRTQGENERQ